MNTGFCLFTNTLPEQLMFNEWVARDTSRKVKSAFKTKFAEGAYYGAYAPLGYKKHPDIKGKLLVDEETKWIVEKIFSLAYQGYGSAKITKVLREEKVPTASWLNFTRYGTFAHIFEGKPDSKRYEWTIAHVKAILKSEVYIGNSVHNRQSTISFKSKKKVRKPESEWFRVENTHEPIIDKEMFYRVQEQIKSRRRQTKEKATPIFAGLVKCADCGWSMQFATNKANKTPYSYYACSYYGQFGKGNCSMHYICALPGFVDSKNEEKTERNAGYLVVSHSGGGMLRQGTRKGIRRTPANRGMRAHWVVKGLDISEDVCHGMCP